MKLLVVLPGKSLLRSMLSAVGKMYSSGFRCCCYYFIVDGDAIRLSLELDQSIDRLSSISSLPVAFFSCVLRDARESAVGSLLIYFSSCLLFAFSVYKSVHESAAVDRSIGLFFNVKRRTKKGAGGWTDVCAQIDSRARDLFLFFYFQKRKIDFF